MSAPEHFDETFAPPLDFEPSRLMYKNSAQYRSIKCETGTEQILPDRSSVVLDENGNVTFISYSTGATVVRHQEFVMCTNVFSEHWFRTRSNNWFRLD